MSKHDKNTNKSIRNQGRDSEHRSSNDVNSVVDRWVRGEISYDTMKSEYLTIQAREILKSGSGADSRSHKH